MVFLLQSIPATKEYEACKADPNIRYPEKEMLARKDRGQYQGCFSNSHWGGKWKQEKWDVFADTCNNLAHRHSEIPNLLRPVLGIENLKHANSQYKAEEGLRNVPTVLASALESLLVDRIQAGEEVTVDFASSVLFELIKLWNSSLESLRNDVRDQLRPGLLAEVEARSAEGAAAELPAQMAAANALDEAMKQLNLHKISVKDSDANLKKVARKTCARVGLHNHDIHKQSKHLHYDHPAMEAVRAYVQQKIKHDGVHPRLIANFDQVWCLQYQPARTILGYSGKRKENLKPSDSRMLASIRAALGIGGNQEVTAREPAQAPQLNAQGQVQPVEYARAARTTTTVSWSDGHLGRAYVTAASGVIPEALMKEMNKELDGILHISSQHESSTHMWNAGTLADFLPFLAVELRARRLALKLTVQTSKALVLADKAAVHSSAAFRRLRERFERENNCILVCGEDLLGQVHVPGGWGACGAPNDGFHQHFHALRRAYMRAAIGQGACTNVRQRLEDLGVGIDGHARYTTFVLT